MDGVVSKLGRTNRPRQDKKVILKYPAWRRRRQSQIFLNAAIRATQAASEAGQDNSDLAARQEAAGSSVASAKFARRLARFALHEQPDPMKSTSNKMEHPPEKPISVGLTCWRWQRPARTIAQLAQRLGVTLQLTQHIRGLRREVECQVSGKNVDRFIGEFIRHC